MKKQESSRRTQGPGLSGKLSSYFTRHAQTFFGTLGQLLRAPFSMLMTAAVIGIALALPTGLHVLLQNAQLLSGELEDATQISLFLKQSVNEDQAKRLVNKLQNMQEVGKVRFISREKALQEFKQYSGFGEAMKALQENPLPHVVVINPAIQQTSERDREQLLSKLRDLVQVDTAQLDVEWIKRLYSIMDMIKRGVWILASMLALAVLLVVGNTIRLAIQNRRDEIVIIKLIGGTDTFIRRPFLYTGFWYGLFGALIAFALVMMALYLLSDPIKRLAELYHSPFNLSALNLESAAVLFAAGILLGLSGSWLAVGRHLKDIEPG
ncbi:MAG: permease-like cell division protein FtsX [Gammaproteobacteria bacterium]|nr:permease-like cell division protein FtsX [Gammaproteobacteria bacterium]